MTTWAPNSPDVLGVEWLPTEQGYRALNSDGKAAAMKIRSTVTEDVTFLALGVLPGSVLRRSASDWWVEIFEEGDEIPGPVTTTTYRPNAVDASTSNWANAAAATFTAPDATKVTNAIGEEDLSTSDYIQYKGTYQAKAPIRLEFDTTNFPANRRVVGGRLVLVANRAEASGQVQVSYRDPDNGVNWFLGVFTVDQETRTFEIPWPEANPATGEPWTQADIAALDTGTNGASIRIKPFGVGKNKPLRIYQVYLEIDHVAENRVAGALISTGENRPIQSFDGLKLWPEVSAAIWTDFSPWAKVDGISYTFLVRRIPRHTPSSSADAEVTRMVGGQIGWTFLKESDAVAAAVGRSPQLPDGFMASYEPSINEDGTVASMGDAGVRGYCIGMRLGGGGTHSVDGQPYCQLATMRIADDSGMERAWQEFTTPGASTGTYETLRLLVTEDTEERAAGAVSSFDVSVRRASDNTLMGSAVTTIDLDDYAEVGKVGADWGSDEGKTWQNSSALANLMPDGATPAGAAVRLLELDIGSATLANATQYRIDMEETADTFVRWVVMRELGYGQEGNDSASAGIGGQTDQFIQFDRPIPYLSTTEATASYTWSTTTTDADPGSPYVRANSATLASVTRINVDDVDNYLYDRASYNVAGSNIDRYIVLYQTIVDAWAIYKITAVTDPGTYTKFTVTHVDSSGGPFTDMADVLVEFVWRSASMDAAFQLVDPPAAPTGFASTVSTQTLFTPDVTQPEWLVESLEYVALTWTATALVGDFGYYEIQRSSDAGTTWESIAQITDEAVEAFNDYEGWRNVEATYRMRVVTSFATSSDWTASTSETPLMTDCALLFTSNEDPDLNVGYVDVGGERRWTFLSADERQTHTLVGRNYQVVTAPLEHRGDQFEVTLAVWVSTDATVSGRVAFDAIEAMSNAATSYICVLDETGRRWFADVAVSEGRKQANAHEAVARIIELTDVPSLVDVAS